MSDRKKPTAGFWITVALVAVLAAYPLSFGPACWIEARTQDDGVIPVVYRPGFRIARLVPAFDNALIWYANIGSPRNGEWRSDVSDDPIWMLFPSLR